MQNFEAIRSWAEQNQVTESNDDEVEFRPEDIVLSEIP